MALRIVFYKTARGDSPFESYIGGQNAKVQAKFIKLLGILGESGEMLRRPYADFLRDGIWELRVGFGGNAHRALFFFARETVVMTHAFTKKTDAVPVAEIERALRYKLDFERRAARGECDL